ncbi:MAG: MFS transporter [Acidobacteriota bacterium]
MSSPTAADTIPRGRVLAWAMYDWGNSAFATTVVAGLFPVFFKDYWSEGVDASQSTFHLSLGVSIASLLVALLAPALGVAVDQGASRKRLLVFFAGISIALTAALALIPQGQWLGALFAYSLAFAAWLLSLVIYDSMILLVTRPDTVDRVSGLGYALGYLGGGLLFAVNAAATYDPSLVGLVARGSTDTVAVAAARTLAVKLSFVSVAVWWAVFMLPLLWKVPDTSRSGSVPLIQAWRQGVGEVLDTFRELRRYRYAFAFLLAFWLYIDGVDTVYTMALGIGKDLGFSTADLIMALLLVQFVAFPFAWAYGWMAGRVGAKPMILVGLATYVLVTAGATQITTTPVPLFGLQISQFQILALLVGTAQGGVQALSRSLFTRLIPRERAGEFFGFYNLLGRFAAVLGPLLLGVVTRITGDSRLGMGSVGLLLISGGILLWRLDVAEGQRAIESSS